MSALCRHCAAAAEEEAERCAACGSPRIVRHPELHALAIAHIDCDAFYASVEKRDRPELANVPVIVGGGRRGVVAACCYIARMKGVRSAMPMYQALKACPDAVVVRPSMDKYARVGAEIREMMRAVTPLVEPLSIDEAFLDLSGTEKLHHGSPAQTLAKLIRRIETEVGVTASVGLSHNKFLAKLASDLDKPRGFAVIGRAETAAFLAPRPVGTIWGVGASLRARLERDGIKTVGQIREHDEAGLMARYGVIGQRLYRLARGEDSRGVNPRGDAKSISAETTFERDVSDAKQLALKLWPLCEKVSRRLRDKGLAAGSVTLKLKTGSFRSLTRAHKLSPPTQLAEVLYRSCLPLLDAEATGPNGGRAYRLIGVGASTFSDPALADFPDLLDDKVRGYARVEEAMEAVRRRFGRPAISKGRSYMDR
jgi:DNA polymerase-4